MAKNTYFQFKKFRVDQAQCGMKVTSDACLFGSSIPYSGKELILDIGTGTGVLALMAAQRSEGRVDAVEIDENAVSQAIENVKNSPWKDRIRIIRTSIQDYAERCEEKYDRIICNPPFYSGGTKSKDMTKRSAWHNEHLPYLELISSVEKCLLSEGVFHIILPLAESQEFERLCEERRCLYPIERTQLRHFPGSRVTRVFTAYQKVCKPCVEKDLVVYQEEPKLFTETAHRMLKDFYLKL